MYIAIKQVKIINIKDLRCNCINMIYLNILGDL